MPKVIFKDRDLIVEAQQGEPLLSCIRRAGLTVDSTCDGKGKCGKCRITVQGKASPRDETEMRRLADQPAEVRLACRATVSGDVEITLHDDWTKLKSVFGLSDREVPLDSLIKRLAPVALPPESSSPHSVIFPGRVIGPHALREIALRDRNQGKASGVAFRQEILDIRFDERPLLGAAVDLGTTNISLSVFNLENGTLTRHVVSLESANSLRRGCHYPHKSLPSRSAGAIEATKPCARKNSDDVG